MKTAFRQTLPRVGVHAVIVIAIMATLALPARAGSVPQLMEDTALTQTIQTPLSTATEICENGAKWMRLNFKQLQMGPYDSLTLTSSGGDSMAFDGSQWNNQKFSTRALRGSCVQVKTFFGSSASRFEVDSYQYGTRALEETTVTVAGVGDICDSDANCSKTAALIANIAPVAVFTAGDNAYEDGSLAEYNREYNTYWGPFKSYTKPTPGNHEYQTASAKGYFDYFNGTNNTGTIAGERGKGYYSWDVGDWRFIALNSNISMAAGSAQETWLRQNLAANTKPCTAAVFHHPLISRGNYTGIAGVKPLWNALYDYKADLVLVGHDHNYQRYAKADPSLVAKNDGIRQILIGTGGRSFYPLSGTHPLLQKSNDTTYGVLKLTLSATGYTADFVPVAGSTFTDTVTATCNAKPGSTTPDFSVATTSASQTVARGATRSSTLTVASSGGFSGAVTLSLTGLPTGVTYALGTNPVNVGANASASSALTLTASATASLGSFPVTVNAVSGSLSRSTPFTLTVTSGNQPPTANFSFVTNGLTATFTDSSTDSDGTIASRSWNFGDGSPVSTATNPSRVYAAAGTYTVTLTVTDNAGATNTKTGSVTVSSTPVNVAPVANFTSSTSGLTATFTDSSTDSDGTIVSRSWNFGDGSPVSTATNPTRVYAAAGTYTVTLTVTDNAGASRSVQKPVTVTSGGSAAQLLVNPGFESGNVTWSSSSGVITNTSTATPRSGTWVAWLNGYGTTHTDTLSQSVSIPSGRTSATLSFYLRITSDETTTTTRYDTLTVEVRNAAGSVLKTCATYSNLDKATGYVKRTCDLNAYIGQTVTIRFTGVEDSADRTSFRIDDTTLDVL